jgi:hypothetical protein
VVFFILFGFECCITSQEKSRETSQESVVLKNSSGDDEIDQIRKEIKTHSPDENNYVYRGKMLRFRENSLLQQGAILAGSFTPFNINKSDITSIKDKKKQKEEIEFRP